jgi:hypothetical protein
MIVGVVFTTTPQPFKIFKKMIQRMQSIWLIIASALSAAGFWLSFFSGNKLNTNTQVKEWIEYTAPQNMLIMVVTIAVSVAALVTVFMYKDRKRQMLVTIVTALISLVNIALYFHAKASFVEANLDLGAILNFAIPLFLMLAIRAMYKDEQLVKSADRLRD